MSLTSLPLKVRLIKIGAEKTPVSKTLCIGLRKLDQKSNFRDDDTSKSAADWSFFVFLAFNDVFNDSFDPMHGFALINRGVVND